MESASKPRHGAIVLGASLGLFALAAFLIISRFATEANGLTSLDLQWSEQLKAQARASTLWGSVFQVITTLGDYEVLGLISFGLLVALLLWNDRHRGLAVFWIIAVSGAGLLNIGLKRAFARPRPDAASALVAADGWSFPSGHSLGSLVVYGMLAYIVVLTVPRRSARTTLVSALVLLILAIGFSRVYLGAHWPSDVLGGFLIGIAWLTLCIMGVEYTRRRVLVTE